MTVTARLAFAAVCLTLPQALYCFDSQPFNPLHQNLTRAACENSMMSGDAIQLAVTANQDQDWKETNLIPGRNFLKPNGHYSGSHHFDRNSGQTSAEAFLKASDFVKAMRAQCKQKIEDGNVREGLIAMGRALHALQDAFAHSNYVALPEAGKRAFRSALREQTGAAPDGLMLTYYHEKDGEVHSDPLENYTHFEHAKDNDKKNADAKTVDPGMTKSRFTIAYDGAQDMSRTFVADLRKEISPGAWAKLEVYRR